jgi:FixJ family two-component response regulator
VCLELNSIASWNSAVFSAADDLANHSEVMGLIVSGMQSKNVASTLGMSEITVAVHSGRVMRKMHAASPVELGRMAEKLNLPSIK